MSRGKNMCGRNSLNISNEKLAELYEADQNQSDFSVSYNVAPGQTQPTVRQGSTVLEDMEWSFVPSWADSYHEWSKKSVINARIETIEKNNLFKDSYQKRRCIVPSTGFFEWKGSRGSKQPYHIKPLEKEVFSFAGIWSVYEEEKRVTYAIVTRDSYGKLEDLHDRMPVILTEDQEKKWIEGELDKEDIEQIPDDRIEVYPVTQKVNNPEFDEEKAVERKKTLGHF